MTEFSLIDDLIEAFQGREQTLAFAESCTGGLLSAQLTKRAGVSTFFLGSVVSYSNEAKETLLGVEKQSLIDKGAVSELVARQMALGAQRAFQTDWAIAITGIAGPGGGSQLKPVGTVCLACVGPDFVKSSREFFEGDRIQIQEQSVVAAVRMLLGEMKPQSR